MAIEILKSENRNDVSDVVSREVGKSGGKLVIAGDAALVDAVAVVRASEDFTTITFEHDIQGRSLIADNSFTVTLSEGEYFDLITPMKNLTCINGSLIAAFY